MSACVIGHITVRDEEKWAQYRAQVPATLAPWGAELLFRGKVESVLPGSLPHSDTVVIRFLDTAAVAGWYRSAAYRALIPLREQAADLVLISFAD